MIHAGYVRDQELNDEAVVLRDEDGVSLAIQRSLEPDEQGRAAGMDTYCLVVDDGATHYGGVVEWSRDAPDLVVLVLSAEAADALGLPRELDLELDPTELDHIDPVVQRLLAAGSTRRAP